MIQSSGQPCVSYISLVIVRVSSFSATFQCATAGLKCDRLSCNLFVAFESSEFLLARVFRARYIVFCWGRRSFRARLSFVGHSGVQQRWARRRKCALIVFHTSRGGEKFDVPRPPRRTLPISWRLGPLGLDSPPRVHCATLAPQVIFCV
jgi:hypothetical protein